MGFAQGWAGEEVAWGSSAILVTAAASFSLEQGWECENQEVGRAGKENPGDSPVVMRGAGTGWLVRCYSWLCH